MFFFEFGNTANFYVASFKHLLAQVDVYFVLCVYFLRYSSTIKSDSGSGIHDNASGERPTEEDLMPDYVPREGESESVKRARLLYQSRYGCIN